MDSEYVFTPVPEKKISTASASGESLAPRTRQSTYTTTTARFGVELEHPYTVKRNHMDSEYYIKSPHTEPAEEKETKSKRIRKFLGEGECLWMQARAGSGAVQDSPAG